MNVIKCRDLADFNSINDRINVFRGYPNINTITYAEPEMLEDGVYIIPILGDVEGVLTASEVKRMEVLSD